MIYRGILFCLFILLQIPINLPAQQPVFEVIPKSSSAITVKASFPRPQKMSSDAGKVYYTDTGYQLRQMPGLPVIPFITKLISLQGQQATIRINQLRTAKIALGNHEKYVSVPPGSGADYDRRAAETGNMVTIAYQGLFRDVPLYALTVFPVHYQKSGHFIEYLENIEFDIYTTKESGATSTTAANLSRTDQTLAGKLVLNNNIVRQAEIIDLNKTVLAGQRFQPGRYKIAVNQTGLFKITYNDLLENEVHVEQFNTRKLKLYNRGQEIPVYFRGGADGKFDPGDYFEFWGEINRSSLTKNYPDVYNDPFTDVNIYWLVQGESNGLRMVEESGSLTVTNQAQYVTPRAFNEILHFEEDNQFVRFGHASADLDSFGYTMDHWFFDRGVSAVGSRTYQADLIWPFTEIGSRSVFVTAMMRGLSEYDSKTNPLQSHQAELWLNDEKVAASGDWPNQKLHVLTNRGGLGVSQNSIQHGANQLRIVMDQTGVTDIAILNWFEIEYLRRYRANKNFIRFRKQDNIPEGYIFQFEVDGFTSSNIEIYKLGISKLVNNRVDFNTATDNHASYRISFQDEIFYPGIEYIALTPDAKKKPLWIRSDEPWQDNQDAASLYDITNTAEYLIITDDLFYDNVKQLEAYRENSGLVVEIVRVEDIYDEFNYGIKSPLAIRKFLKYAFKNWNQNRPLLYVVLVGSASFDYRERRGAKKDHVPTFLFETNTYGASGSDFPYTLVSGVDFVSDLIVSRIPVSSNSELNAYMDKIQGYEAPENIGEWRNKGLFISGNDFATDEVFTGKPAFRVQNQRLINMQTPPGYFTRKLNTIQDPDRDDGDPNFGGTNDLIDYFDDGLSMVNFYGHGGGGIWADVQLMNTSDVDRLSEHYRLPFVQSMTCFTGAFENGSINGLADKLLLTERKGAIGVLAASGVGWLYNDFALGWQVNDLLLEKDLTIGEAILFAKIIYAGANEYVTEAYDRDVPSFNDLYRSMVSHYNLFGDPFIKLTIPQTGLLISPENYLPAAGDTVSLSLSAPFASGSGRLELVNSDHEPQSEYFFALTEGRADINVIIPSTGQKESLYLKAYASDNLANNDARGYVAIAVNKSFVDSIVTTPRIPEVGDFLQFTAYLKSPEPLALVRITNFRGGNSGAETLNLKLTEESVWHYADNFGPYLKADTVYYDLEMVDSVGNVYASRRHRLIISDPRPDLQIMKQSLGFNGINEIELNFDVMNNSTSSFSNIDIAIFADAFKGAEIPVASQVLDFQALETKRINFTLDPGLLTAGRLFYAAIDRDNKVIERDEQNNIKFLSFPDNLYNVSPELGTTIDGASNDTILLADNGRLHIAPGALTASSVLSYTFDDEQSVYAQDLQPGFQYINFSANRQATVLNLNLLNPLAGLLKPAYIEFQPDTSGLSHQELGDIAICQYFSDIGRWSMLNTNRNGTVFRSEIQSSGRFALFRISDNQNPVIEITVNGRTLSPDMYIPSHPDLALILQDENGIDISRGFSILIDNDSLDAESIVIPDSVPNANAVSILTTPTLQPGQHSITVQVRDVNGNVGTKSVNFIVASDFDLRIYGNYPNPFEDETIISFEIIAQGILETFSVKIYTVSGRKIREITRNAEYPDEIWAPGYHEINWNGLDQDQNPVANGVYFAVISGKYRGKTIEHTLKLAKLK